MSDPDAPGGDSRRPAPRGTEEETQTRVAIPELHSARYRLLEQIGAGGMGVVYRGVDVELERPVALKRPLDRHLGDGVRRERLVREARAASKLSHPNVVQVFEEEGVPWIAMELVPGRSLSRVLREDGPLPLEDLLRHGEGLADALALAHERGVLHRDVNPGNILIGDDGRARLSDFGIARAVGPVTPGSDPEPALTGRSTTLGTPGYMSPEQALGRPLDGRTDIFNFGLVLYEMATGRQLFPTSGSGEWLDALLHHDPPKLSEDRGELPPELERIVARALARRPHDRYADCTSLRDDLARVRETTRSGRVRAAPGRAAVRRAVLWAITVVAVATAAGVLWRARPAPDPLDDLSEWTPRRLTSDPGWEAEPDLSPDGTLVAYAADRSGNSDVWVLDLIGGDPFQLTDASSADTSPCWLPDGTAVLFVSDRSGARSIWRVPRLGGSPSLVVSDAVDPDVSPDGKRLAFARVDGSGFHRIFVVPFDDPDAAVQLTGDDDGLWNHRDPAWSPEGRRICYAAHRDLWMATLDDGRVRPLTRDGEADASPAWTSDAKSIVFTSPRDEPPGSDRGALWRIDVDSGSLQRLTLGVGPDRDASLSTTGRRIVFSQEGWNFDIVLRRRHDGRQTLFDSRVHETSPALAPDGRYLAYEAAPSGTRDLVVQSLEDGEPEGRPATLHVNGGGAVLVTSPDGDWLAFHRVVESQRDVWTVPSSGGLPIRFTDHPAVDVNPAFAPDGRSIAFASDRDGTSRIWTAPFSNGRRAGAARRLTGGDGQDFHPMFSPDGRHLAWIRYQDGNEDVWVIDLEMPGSDRQLTHGELVYRLKWLPEPDGLVAAGLWDRRRWSLRHISLNRSSPTAQGKYSI